MRTGRAVSAMAVAAALLTAQTGCAQGEQLTERVEIFAPPALPRTPLIAEPVTALSGGGYSVVELAAATVAVDGLDLEVAAGRVIVASVSNPDPAAASALVSAEHLAGVIVMGDAVQSADQVRALTAAVAEAAAADGQTAPAVISVDQEGGPVARLDSVMVGMPGFMAAGAQTDQEAVTDAYRAMGDQLRELGFTVDWAPVADVTIGAADPTIGVRSAGDDPTRVATTVLAAVDGFSEAGIMTAVKHFPGHGSVTTDSHQGLPVQGASMDQLLARDLVPFVAAVDADAPMVMVGHIEVTAWGAGAASVTPEAYRVLREDLGFDGVAVTDALNMAALPEAYPGANAVAALSAGADLLLLPADPAAARQAIIAAVSSGQVPRERLDEALVRVSLLMAHQDALSAAAVDRAAAAQSEGTGVDAASGARSFAASSAVVISPTCAGPLVPASVRLVGGGEHEREVLAAALAEHGIGQGGSVTIDLVGSANRVSSADVVVALDAPWGLAQSQSAVRIGLFGRSDDSLRGLADVLADASVARGTWPVAGLDPGCAG